MKPIDFLGYIGAILTLTAFFQISSGRWHGQSKRYQIMNLAAGIILAYYAWVKHAYANILLNSVWCTVAVYGIYVAYTLGVKKSAPSHKTRKRL